MTAPSLLALCRQAASAWIDDYAASMGAALAYYTLFSIAPLLLIVISIAGLVFGADAARGQIFAELRGLMGDDGAAAAQGLLQSVNKPAQGALATVVGFALLGAGAISIFGELQNALDRIWRAPVRTGASGLWALVRTRLLSFAMVLGIGLLLVVSLVVSAAVAAIGKFSAAPSGVWSVAVELINLVVSSVLVTVAFAMIYKIVPRVRIAWRDVWTGAAATALLFAIGKSLIGVYLGRVGVASGFGAAGSLVVMLVWMYYSAQIFLLGAEFTKAYAHACGSRSAGGSSGAPVGSLPVAGDGAVERSRSALARALRERRGER